MSIVVPHCCIPSIAARKPYGADGVSHSDVDPVLTDGQNPFVGEASGDVSRDIHKPPPGLTADDACRVAGADRRVRAAMAQQSSHRRSQSHALPRGRWLPPWISSLPKRHLGVLHTHPGRDGFSANVSTGGHQFSYQFLAK